MQVIDPRLANATGETPVVRGIDDARVNSVLLNARSLGMPSHGNWPGELFIWKKVSPAKEVFWRTGAPWQ